MNKAEFNVQLRSVFNLAALTRQLKIADLLEAMNRAENLGPVIDPTLYLKASEALKWQKRIVEAALTFQQTIEEIIAEEGGNDE